LKRLEKVHSITQKSFIDLKFIQFYGKKIKRFSNNAVPKNLIIQKECSVD
jgi:hypothetical protein